MKVKIIDAGSVGARMNSILFVLHCRDKTIKILTALELGWNLWWAGYFYMDILLYSRLNSLAGRVAHCFTGQGKGRNIKGL